MSLGRSRTRAPQLPVEAETGLGGLSLLARGDREEAQARAEQAGLMWISIPAPESSERGRLALVVEAAIEDELANRGAGAAGFGAATNLDATLSDQLYRARTLSARGFALSFDTLARMTNLAGALDAEDSAILRWWLTASRERPVRILFDARDRYLGVYTRPVALETLLGDPVETFLTAAEELPRPVSTQPETTHAEVGAEAEIARDEVSVEAEALLSVEAEALLSVEAEAQLSVEAAGFAALSNADALSLTPWNHESSGYSLADLTRELRESSPPPPPSRRSVPPPPPSPIELEAADAAVLSPEEAAAAGQLSLDLDRQAIPSEEAPEQASGSDETARAADAPTPASEARQFAFRSVLAALEALENEDFTESPVAPAAEQDWGTPEPPDETLFGDASNEEVELPRDEQLEPEFNSGAVFAQPQEEALAAVEHEALEAVSPEHEALDAASPEHEALDAASPEHEALDAASLEQSDLNADAVLAAVHQVVVATPEALVEPDGSPLSDGFAALLTQDDQTPLPTRHIRADQLDASTRGAPRETFDDTLDRRSQAPEATPELSADAEAEPLTEQPERQLQEQLTSESHTVVETQVEAREAFGPIATHGHATLEVLEDSGAADAEAASASPQATMSCADEDEVTVPESTWRGWVRDLEAARGPKPLAVVERLFTSAYVPLLAARMNQELDAQAHDALESWSTAFAKSYSEAFDALRIRGKRPTMVLDVPEIALRHGRMHGARQAQLILVDGLRFDLGQMVHEQLKELVGRDAACVERLLLWSALPATTATQLELLGRGPQGLREPIASERDVPVARGRAASTLRRVKAGHRDVMKLDLVESRITEPGATRPRAMRELSTEVAEVLWDHMSGLPARTLVLIFGDHGFAIDPSTGIASHSSRAPSAATPEEVLVPAFAWLTGSVH